MGNLRVSFPLKCKSYSPLKILLNSGNGANLLI